MLVGIVGWLYGPVVIAAFTGSLVFVITQQDFSGVRQVALMFVSFTSGLMFPDTIQSVLNHYLPDGIHAGKELSAFVTSAFIVKSLSFIDLKLSGHKWGA